VTIPVRDDEQDDSENPGGCTEHRPEWLAICAEIGRELDRPLSRLTDLLRRYEAESSPGSSEGSLVQNPPMSKLCDDLRDLTRGFVQVAEIRCRKPVATTRSLRLKDVLNRLDREYATIARSLGLRWECRLTDSDVVIETDPALLHRLLDMLIGRAIGQSDSGDAILVEGGPQGEGWALRISSENSLCSDPVSVRPAPPETWSESPQPLAISEGSCYVLVAGQELVEALGGRLRLESGASRGSRISLEWPTLAGRAAGFGL
jgi:signal transduction histidine kinase